MIDDAKRWHDRADEIRVMADEMNNESARRMMYQLAEDYDNLGDRALERQENSNAEQVLSDSIVAGETKI